MEQIVNREQRAVQSVEVGGRLLIALGQHAAPMSLKDLAAAAELPASRAHPYLVSFGRLGLIEQDGTSGRYALGPAALQLGLACLHQLDPIKAAGPVAEALSQAIDQTVAIAVWANFGPTIVRVIEGSQPLHVNMRAGTVMSIVNTATGRVFAAYLPPKIAQHHIASELADERAIAREPRRPRKDDLDAMVAEVRAHGIARAVGMPIPGINALSAPVFDHTGALVLAVTTLGPAGSFDPEWNGPLAAHGRFMRGMARAAADKPDWAKVVFIWR